MLHRFILVWVHVVFALSIPGGAATAQSLTADELFSGDRVVQIEIEIPTDDWNTIRLQSRKIVTSLAKTPAESPFTYVKGTVTINGVRVENVGIRKKGFLGSLDDSRPSLKIKFAEFLDQQPISGLDRLTLNNNKQDASRLSQYLGSKLYNQSGTVAPRCSLAVVTVNGESLGIYSNVESVKRPFLNRGFGDDSGSLYEGTVADFYDSWVNKFEPKNKYADLQSIQTIAQVLETDPLDVAQLESLIDVDAFLNFWAMESLLGFWDGYCNNQNNFFIYRNPANDLWYFLPWGIDSAFSKTMPLPPFRVRPRAVHAQAILPNKLYRVPEFRDRYLQRLSEFLDQHWNEESLIAEIDRMEAMISDHVVLEVREFSRAVQTLRRFVTTRRKELNKEMDEGPPILKSRHRKPAYFVEIGQATVIFSTQWYDTTPADATEASDVQIQMKLHGEPVELENVGAYAERSKWPSPDKVKPPSIVIFGTRKSDGKRLTLGMGLSPNLFKPTAGESVDIGGVFLVNSNFISPSGGMRMIGGRAQLKQASVDKGQPVSGSLELSILEMKGGKPVGDSPK